jgi:hypothetical protein
MNGFKKCMDGYFRLFFRNILCGRKVSFSQFSYYS